MRVEIQKLQSTLPQVVVGTPGRVFDMLSREIICKFGTLLTFGISTLRVSREEATFVHTVA